MKFFFLLFVAGVLYFLSVKFFKNIDTHVVQYLLFPLIFIIINFAIFRLLFFYISYFNNLIIIQDDHVTVIKTTFIDTDNIEIIDREKITKIDTAMEGIFQNIISSGNLIIEQNRDRVRVFNYIYKPYKAVNYLKNMKNNLVKGNSKKES